MNKRLPEIDFVKGVAIVSVLLLHTLPEKILYLSFASLHIWQAVPLFIFVTFYLSFKSLVANSERDILSNYFSSKRIIRVAKEVALPFFAVVALQVFLRSIRAGESFDISDLCRGWGGVGPGSYYFWVYLQLWLIIPFLYIVLRKNKSVGIVFTLVISIILNFCCDRIGISESLYGRLCIRYIFLSAPAYALVDFENKGLNKFPAWIILAVFVSFVYLILFNKLSLSPVILDYGWAVQQWPAYFWTYLVFIGLIIYGRRRAGTKFVYYFNVLGKNSWYIFLAQMFVLSIVNVNMLGFIENIVLRTFCFVISVSAISISPALIRHYFKRRFHEI